MYKVSSQSGNANDGTKENELVLCQVDLDEFQ